MRRRLALFVLLLAAASPAVAQTPRPTRVIVQPVKPIPVPSAPPVPVAPATPLMSPLMSAAPAADAAIQCRSSCAKTYYLCLSTGDGVDDCPSSWSQCAARCNRPG